MSSNRLKLVKHNPSSSGGKKYIITEFLNKLPIESFKGSLMLKKRTLRDDEIELNGAYLGKLQEQNKSQPSLIESMGDTKESVIVTSSSINPSNLLESVKKTKDLEDEKKEIEKERYEERNKGNPHRILKFNQLLEKNDDENMITKKNTFKFLLSDEETNRYYDGSLEGIENEEYVLLSRVSEGALEVIPVENAWFLFKNRILGVDEGGPNDADSVDKKIKSERNVFKKMSNKFGLKLDEDEKPGRVKKLKNRNVDRDVYDIEGINKEVEYEFNASDDEEAIHDKTNENVMLDDDDQEDSEEEVEDKHREIYNEERDFDEELELSKIEKHLGINEFNKSLKSAIKDEYDEEDEEKVNEETQDQDGEEVSSGEEEDEKSESSNSEKTKEKDDKSITGKVRKREDIEDKTSPPSKKKKQEQSIKKEVKQEPSNVKDENPLKVPVASTSNLTKEVTVKEEAPVELTEEEKIKKCVKKLIKKKKRISSTELMKKVTKEFKTPKEMISKYAKIVIGVVKELLSEKYCKNEKKEKHTILVYNKKK